VTYVARNLEPVRGFHVFMRALPDILDARPEARALIVGGNGTSYGKASDDPGGYRAVMEREVGDRIDWDRVHFLGRVPYASYRSILRISRCHVYLTVPFVVSWSLLEAMSMGATIVAVRCCPGARGPGTRQDRPSRRFLRSRRAGPAGDRRARQARATMPRSVAPPGTTWSTPTTSTRARCRRMWRRSTTSSQRTSRLSMG
jgi:hypothetical protein